MNMSCEISGLSLFITAMVIQVFWDVTLCYSNELPIRRGMFDPEDGGISLRRNVWVSTSRHGVTFQTTWNLE
jgi:hypothetical protein